ncbi:MAG: PD-(D/E)XK nuclease family protein [Puia sp.]
MSDFQFLLLQGQQPPEMERVEMDFINRVLENFQMNVTALNNYLKCPLEFYFKNLIRIPSPKNENTEFGSSAHFALEQLFRKMMENDKKFPESGFFIASFDCIWTATGRVLPMNNSGAGRNTDILFFRHTMKNIYEAGTRS